MPFILRRKNAGWVARTVLLDLILLCEVAFPSAVHPSLVLNIGLLCPFLAKEAEQTKATITWMLCRVRDSPSKPEAQAHGVGTVGLGRTLLVARRS